MRKKNVKTTKRVHAFKGFTSSYNVEILFAGILLTLNNNLKILNKLKKLLIGLKGFKFVTVLVLVHKIIGNDK